jgi:hypothetical protein
MGSGDEPREQLVVPSVTTAVRNVMCADVGTIIYNTTTSKLNFCKAKAVGSGNWEAVTSG